MLLILVVSTAIGSEIVLLLVIVSGSVKIAKGMAVSRGISAAKAFPAIGLMAHLHL